jgi:hypothetical protein
LGAVPVSELRGKRPGAFDDLIPQLGGYFADLMPDRSFGERLARFLASIPQRVNAGLYNPVSGSPDLSAAEGTGASVAMSPR